jgi:cysteine sulfinate desulfinase/cysteine desulfurase-like protein
MFGTDSPETKGSIRFSFSAHNTEAEVLKAAAKIKEIVGQKYE